MNGQQTILQISTKNLRWQTKTFLEKEGLPAPLPPEKRLLRQRENKRSSGAVGARNKVISKEKRKILLAPLAMGRGS